MSNKTILRGFNLLANHLSKKRKLFLTTSLNYKKRSFNFSDSTFDYIRYATLELLVDEIISKGLEGNVAEVGVYKGEFAKYLNKCLPDKNIYLFDTFTGFDDRDVKNEITNGYSVAKANKEFANTSIQEVLGKMLHRDKVIIKQGFFPESASDVNDKFCLISLDADLYDPIYSGLQFFYPKLVPGGYILIHDYNNENYKGAKKAVFDFCNKNNLGFVPIPDTAGTAIISK